MARSPAPRLDAIEALLRDLIPRLSPAPSRRGRPEILPGALLWTGVLVCLLRGQGHQQAVWRLLSQTGLWDFPRVPVGAEAVRIRLQQAGSATMRTLFAQVSAELAAQQPEDRTLAPFARGVFAIDESTLDRVARTLPALRPLPSGDDGLLPGKLIAAFNVRTQQFQTVLTTDVPRQNERVAARDLVATLPTGSLILADLGYFGFRWFDDLTDDGYHFLSKLRAKTSCEVVHVLSADDRLRDELVWLGAHRADRAKHLVRRIQVPVGTLVQTYLTNVLDPARLPIAEVIRLYARRWDIELAFRLVKRELGLHLVWSAKWDLILMQGWGVLLITQIALAVRSRIADRAQIDLFDVSLTLLLQNLPRFAERGESDLIGVIAALPVGKGGYLRPSRRVRHVIPEPVPVTEPPPDLVRTRTPRYAGRACGSGRLDRRPAALAS